MDGKVVIVLGSDSALLVLELEKTDELKFEVSAANDFDRANLRRWMLERIRKNPQLRDAFRCATKLERNLIIYFGNEITIDQNSISIGNHVPDEAIINYLLGTYYKKIAA